MSYRDKRVALYESPIPLGHVMDCHRQHLVHEQVELGGRQPTLLQRVVCRHQHSGHPKQLWLGLGVLLACLVIAEHQEQQEPC